MGNCVAEVPDQRNVALASNCEQAARLQGVYGFESHNLKIFIIKHCYKT